MVFMVNVILHYFNLGGKEILCSGRNVDEIREHFIEQTGGFVVKERDIIESETDRVLMDSYRDIARNRADSYTN
jgi:hypothetical protein